MADILKEKQVLEGREHKPKKSSSIEQTIAQLEGVLDLGFRQEPWWSTLIYWVKELRWRKMFWKRMGCPSKPEIKQ